MANWVSIRADYVSGGVSYRELSERHSVPLGSIKRHAAKEGWAALRTEADPNRYPKTVREAARKKADREADRLTRLLDIGDQLADKLAQAGDQLGACTIVRRKGEHVITDGEGNKRLVEDAEEIAVPAQAVICAADVKRLTSALKDLRDVVNTPRADRESLQRIASLMAGLDDEAKEEPQDGPVKPETEGVPTEGR